MVQIRQGTWRRCAPSQRVIDMGFDASLQWWHGVHTGFWNKLDGKTNNGIYTMECIGYPIEHEPETESSFPAIEATIDGRRTWIRIVWLAVGPFRSPHPVYKTCRMRVEGVFPASEHPVLGQPRFNILDIGDVSRASDWERVMEDARIAYSVIHGVIINRGRPKGSGQPISLDRIRELRSQGYTQEEMAPEFGLSPRRFKERLREMRIADPTFKIPPRKQPD